MTANGLMRRYNLMRAELAKQQKRIRELEYQLNVEIKEIINHLMN